MSKYQELFSHRVWNKHNPNDIIETREGKTKFPYIIHHKDRNNKNNNIENLQKMTSKEHTKLHHTGSKRSKEAKQKMAVKKKGIPLVESHKKNISKSLTGNSYSWTGRKHTEETKQKMSNARKLAWQNGLYDTED